MEKPFTRLEPLLKIEGVCKEIDKKVILRDVGTEEQPFVISNITRPDMREGLKQGQTVALLGRSGSGKSTLMRLMSGVHPVAKGLITRASRSQAGTYVPVAKGDFGYVQQGFPLSRLQSVYQMLWDAAGQGYVSKEEKYKEIDKYLKTWELWDQRFLFPSQLSGGQRQRVAIVEQLLCSHTFILLDEPFSGLDIGNIDSVKHSMNKITTTDEINTIIFSTHDIRLAVELADLIFVIGCETGKPGGTLLGRFDLKDCGLAWSDTFTAAHEDKVQEIKKFILAPR